MSKKTKICKQCGIKKTISEFKVNYKTKDGTVSVCKDCVKENYQNSNYVNSKFNPDNYLFDNNICEYEYVGKEG